MLAKPRLILTVAVLCLIAALVWSVDAGRREQFDCQFERVAGKYTATKRELGRFGLPMITVTRDGRTFMLRRERIVTCEAADADN